MSLDADVVIAVQKIVKEPEVEGHVFCVVPAPTPPSAMTGERAAIDRQIHAVPISTKGDADAIALRALAGCENGVSLRIPRMTMRCLTRVAIEIHPDEELLRRGPACYCAYCKARGRPVEGHDPPALCRDAREIL